MAKYIPTKRGNYNSVKTSGGMSHEQIGAVLGLSRARVQQIEAAAFRKIREQFPELAVLVQGDSGRVDPSIYCLGG